MSISKIEVWKDIPEYEGLYEASTLGRIRTEEGKTTYSALHGERVWKSRILSAKVDKKNSHRVSLYKNKVRKDWLVHRLIALTFLPAIEGKNYVNHIDGNRNNNELENLEWCDHTENNNHAFDSGLIQTGKQVKLINIETNEEFTFRSLSKASLFINRNVGYLSNKIKQKEKKQDFSDHIFDGYKVIIF